MKHILNLTAAAAMLALAACQPAKTETPAPVTPVATAPAAAIRYGDNAAASGTFEHDGAKLYYETYGEGEPILLIHGNGGSIGGFTAQIEHFKAHYKVIAMDSREQGRSTGSDVPITYEQMTDDLAALLDHLKTGPVSVVGWSDGGIEALLLGIRHPDKVAKLVAMAANLNPSTQAVQPAVLDLVKDAVKQFPPGFGDTAEGKTQLKLVHLLLRQPNIKPEELGKIAVPTLILAGDHDLIRTEHTVEIFNALPNGELGVFPNSTHAAPYNNAELFNATVDRFFTTPYRKIDLVPDTMSALGEMGAKLQALREGK
jgi:pimeloyl-ACP methyl ester carboxylesterase